MMLLFSDMLVGMRVQAVLCAYDMPLSVSLLCFVMGTMLANFHM